MIERRVCVCVCVTITFVASLSVVEECVRLLRAGGFTELKEKETWKVQPLGKVRGQRMCI